MPRSSRSRDFGPALLRPWIKKRGSRVLGQTFRGIVGEALFYAGLFLLGVFGLSLIIASRVAVIRQAPIPLPEVSPEITSSGLGTWILGILSAVAILTGIAGLLYRISQIGASNERRSAIRARAKQIELIGPTADQTVKLPGVPQGKRLTESPGERQTYRLGASTQETGIVGTAALTMLWNAAWFTLLSVVLSGFWFSRPRWVLAGLLIPTGFLGVRMFRHFVAQLRRQAGVGPTIVEISDHPLVPGNQYRVHVSQMGRLRLKNLRVYLTCQEEAFFHQGTDVRVERYDAFHQDLAKEHNVRVDPHTPWQQQFNLDLPPDVMHSFVGNHNAIRWRLVVSGESRPWPSFCRSFPVVVHPPGLSMRRNPR
ncbi:MULTISPECIES: hypothetical protein [Crateriforma]|uniref:DUF3592 domain-containing protein n=1 Tax=Crateriforma conspicua TaxID=2527996 RepID=A0A5C6FU40_9PLAN|nr:MULTISPECIES: hypothetical protein [Crateriforma]QDV64774.1 hypothetical protein Mal65_39370 [Crateriforma conspicua]TWT70171.1 hypothetical protein Pan14r_24710 [Crateriforma conspicua]TWU65851.1 hypothetical protein V7x_14050 [Crateriforma conspicua]